MSPNLHVMKHRYAGQVFIAPAATSPQVFRVATDLSSSSRERSSLGGPKRRVNHHLPNDQLTVLYFSFLIWRQPHTPGASTGMNASSRTKHYRGYVTHKIVNTPAFPTHAPVDTSPKPVLPNKGFEGWRGKPALGQ